MLQLAESRQQSSYIVTEKAQVMTRMARDRKTPPNHPDHQLGNWCSSHVCSAGQSGHPSPAALHLQLLPVANGECGLC